MNIRYSDIKSKVGLAIAVGLFTVSTPTYAGPVIVSKFNFEREDIPCPDTANFAYTADTFIFINEGIDAIQTGATGGAALVTSDQTVDLNKYRKIDLEGGTYLTFDLTVRSLAEGEELNLTEINYTYQGIRIISAKTALLSSVDGFVAGKELAKFDWSGPNFRESKNIPSTVIHADLSVNRGFQGLENGDSIKFRIYLGDIAGRPARLHLVDNIVVIGEVVPGVK